jgi:hypothetical protein
MIKHDKDTEFIVQYSTKDIMEKLNSIQDDLRTHKALSIKAMWAAGVAISISLLAISKVI